MQLQIIADTVMQSLSPCCERIALSGSLRRQQRQAENITLVAIPSYHIDHYGQPTSYDDLIVVLRDMIGQKTFSLQDKYGKQITSHYGRQAESIQWGQRHLALIHTRTQTKIDLFIVRPPATWGLYLTWTTGPEDFFNLLMYKASEKGFSLKQGYLVDKNNHPVETEEEREFFQVCGANYISPELR